METVTIRAAKAMLSQLAAGAESGEQIILARGKRPIAMLVPLHSGGKGRRFGALSGIVSIGSEFFEPLPDDELKRWR